MNQNNDIGVLLDRNKDQHFLESRTILVLEKNISNINNKDIIFEIGSGDGRLSQILLEDNPKKLITIEMDERFTPHLKHIKDRQHNENNFEFIIGNGLEEIEKYKFNKFIANIPYSITEPIYNKLLDKKIPFILILHGMDFYKHIIDERSKWHFYINSMYNVDLVKEVPGNAFVPQANVMSALVKLELKTELTKKDKFISQLFKKRSRNCKNTIIFALVDSLRITKKEAKEFVKSIEFSNEPLKHKFEIISNTNFKEIINSFESKFN